jgi:hypothetical protein
MLVFLVKQVPKADCQLASLFVESDVGRAVKPRHLWLNLELWKGNV